MDWWKWIWWESLYFQKYKSRSDKYLLLISRVATCSDTQRQQIPFVAKQKSASVSLSAAVSLPIIANSSFGVESHQPCHTVSVSKAHFSPRQRRALLHTHYNSVIMNYRLFLKQQSASLFVHYQRFITIPTTAKPKQKKSEQTSRLSISHVKICLVPSEQHTKTTGENTEWKEIAVP